MFQRFQPSRLIFTDTDLQSLRPGQWVRNTAGARGQYLGTTAAGVVVIRWQNGKFGTQGNTPQTDARQNGTLRKYAKTYNAR